MTERPRVLVKERIADSGVELLRRHFDVELGTDWDDGQLPERIGDFEGIVIRSATKLTDELIERAGRLRVIGRAGIGVDNVDVDAATKRGIVVANAPQANVIAAAEHTMALMLALARRVPQAHASLTAGRWERSRFAGVELFDKTLGILGLGRIGQLVAARARGFGMRVLAFDPYVAADRYRELGVERAEDAAEVYSQADFITLHLPPTRETRGLIDRDALSRMRDGVLLVNCARGELIVDEDLEAALDSGKVGGAALDVFSREPITDHPLFGYENVVVTPHLGASTAEAQDRAGVQTAEQVVAALTGGVVTTAVNIPAISPEDMDVLGPFVPLCRQLGRILAALGEGPSVDRVEVELRGRIAERDTRLLPVAVLAGLLGHTAEEVNLVNAPSLAEERGITVVELNEPVARDFTDLVRVSVASGEHRVRVVGTTLGNRNRPHLLEAWGQRFNIQLERHLTLFRYRDQPGMIGRVGQAFGDHEVNIVSAAVGRHPGDEDDGPKGRVAVMVVTSDQPVPEDVLAELVASEGFYDARTVSLPV
ncbi:MAG TPA: phosphoglycerate dehydrogenase [Thermoleophilaceae bacterium]|nr:phosphoglycerate dehydrogenase [Thermoleophilaceae bacterium]